MLDFAQFRRRERELEDEDFARFQKRVSDVEDTGA
jgi:hypothetical protein